jgi:hypothetical protein
VEEFFTREIFYYKNYYLKFFSTLAPDVQRKITWTLKLVATVDRIPGKYFKHLEGTSEYMKSELRSEMKFLEYLVSLIMDP